MGSGMGISHFWECKHCCVVAVVWSEGLDVFKVENLL